jgi:Ca2+-transporting ATPase
VWTNLKTPNRTLWVVVAATLSTLLLVLYVPWLSDLFFFAPMAVGELAVATAWGMGGLVWFELLRRMYRGGQGATEPAMR